LNILLIKINNKNRIFEKKIMIKAGVIGAGHLGNIHLKLLNESNFFKLIGYFDIKKNKENHFVHFETIEKLINSVDAIFICTNTPNHYSIAKICIESSKHVFIEKPITSTIEQAVDLIELSLKYNIKGQVGHVERFNSAFTCLGNSIKNPKFIECHRLAEYNPRGNDVSVVLDLMIHDIDIVLNVVNSEPKQVSANGVCVISDSPDICNARVEFENGCVANFTASRISLKNMRKTRFFQSNAYISVDFLEKKTEIVKIKDVLVDDPYAMVIENSSGQKKQIFYNNPEIKKNNAISEEHNSFAKAILENAPISVSLKDGLNALNLASKILNKI
jgi:predicted dehydrogenase